MKIFSIPDVGSFLGLVRKCRGDVMLHLPDGGQVELKRDHTAQQLLQIMYPGQSCLDIRLSNSSDILDFIQYMRESGVSQFVR